MRSKTSKIMNETVRGICKQMCPDDEIKLRESERLLHILEMVPGTETKSRPIADKNRIVKMYTRSAAGLNIASPRNLRTTEALLKTVNYLLQDVISLKILPWHKIYDFVADRLLAVRQDMLVQRLPKSHYISLLQPIVRFYAYSAYRLCELPIQQFDPVLNNIQLQECLKKLLTCYDDCEYFSLQCEFRHNLKINLGDYESIYADCRPLFEALYIIFNLSDITAILRGLSLRKKWKTDVVEKSLRISIAIGNGNWYKACFLIKELPTLLAVTACLHLAFIRREALKKMSVAYHSKNLSYPINVLKEQLLYGSTLDIITDCKFYNIRIEGDSIKFMKDVMNDDIVKPKHEKFVHEKISGTNISHLILEGDVY